MPLANRNRWPPGALAPTLARRVRRISQSVLCLAFVGGASEGPENRGFVRCSHHLVGGLEHLEYLSICWE